jgi:DNA transformation protein and related proteins
MTCPACGLVHALPAADTPLVELPNLGEVSADWLSRAGINTLADLQALGAVKAYLMVQALAVKPSLNLLYALEAALHGKHWLEVKREQKTALLSQLAALKLAVIEEQSLI